MRLSLLVVFWQSSEAFESNQKPEFAAGMMLGPIDLGSCHEAL
jgi:hypothetical protein